MDRDLLLLMGSGILLLMTLRGQGRSSGEAAPSSAVPRPGKPQGPPTGGQGQDSPEQEQSATRPSAPAPAPEQEPVSTSTSPLDQIYQSYATQHGVDWRLLKAIAIVESGENTEAVNPNDPSYGLMQVLCTDTTNPARGCGNKLNVQGWPPPSKEWLFDPEYNVHIAAQILRWNLDTYGMPKGIAVYNSWSARHDPQMGPFTNQDYVNKVLREWNYQI